MHSDYIEIISGYLRNICSLNRERVSSDFSAKKENLSAALGSECSVSFPIQRT